MMALTVSRSAVEGSLNRRFHPRFHDLADGLVLLSVPLQQRKDAVCVGEVLVVNSHLMMSVAEHIASGVHLVVIALDGAKVQ